MGIDHLLGMLDVQLDEMEMLFEKLSPKHEAYGDLIGDMESIKAQMADAFMVTGETGILVRLDRHQKLINNMKLAYASNL